MIKSCFMFLLVGSALWAQVPVAEQRARITGGGGPGGKCTGEVDVDDVVEIQVFGDTARMQTLGGQAATWKRFECSSVMPGNPSGFRFRGIDGRGKQSLVRDPNEGLGVVVLRIEDTQRGRSAYTFDIEWSGGGSAPANTSGNGGFNQTGATQGGGFGNGTQVNGQAPGVADFAYAVHSCQNAVIARGLQNGYTNIQLWAATLQDSSGNLDLVTGNATATPTRGGSQVRVQYQCTIDAATGRITDLQVR